MKKIALLLIIVLSITSCKQKTIEENYQKLVDAVIKLISDKK